ncbi:MAG: metallopeptidase (SprT family), partial [Gammaproteobacteria bacterium]
KMLCVQPINKQQQDIVRRLTSAHIEKAAAYFNREIHPVIVQFDLKGRAAGMYLVQDGKSLIRYNAHLFSKYFEDSIATTVPHEVAHYVADMLYGLENIKPHGMEWKKIMQVLGADASVTANYDLAGIPIRRQKHFNYDCGCMTHQLSAIRHHKIRLGKATYRCKYCGSRVVYTGC